VVPGQGPLRVGGDIRTPQKTRDARPVYPAAALAAGIQGVVIIEVTVGPNGRVTDARVLRAPEDILREPALDAVRQWEYEPTIFLGRPVSVLMTVTVNFSLRGGGLENFGRPGVGNRGGLPLSAPYDLTGEWTSDDGGTYQVRSVGAELFWFGLSSDRTRATIFPGALQNPTEYRGRWVDVPPGADRESGVMTIRVVSQDQLELAGMAPEFEGRRWQRVRRVSSEITPVRCPCPLQRLMQVPIGLQPHPELR
jgi:TonB family protein